MAINPHRKGGSDVPLTDGGTGASNAGSALTNLGGLDETAHDLLDHTGLPGIGAGGGALEHVETKVLGAPATSVNFTGLNGDADGLYIMHSLITSATGTSQVVYVKPNGLALSASFATTIVGLNNPYSATVVIGFYVGTTFSTNPGYGESRLWARSGLRRGYLSNWTTGSGGYRNHGVWTDAGPNITSLLVESTVASEMGIGSRFSLYKITD